MSAISDNTQTAQTTPKKVGRPKKYHTLEEFSEARKRYYATKRAKIQQQAQQRKELDARKCELQRQLTRMLQDNVYTEQQMKLVQEVLDPEEYYKDVDRVHAARHDIFHMDEELDTAECFNTRVKAPPQSDTDS